MPIIGVSEPGYNGQLVSLGGVHGLAGYGRIVQPYQAFILSGLVLVLPANPKRISAMLQNWDDAANPGSRVLLFLGGQYGQLIQLLAYGSLQIDNNFPWTGEIYANAVANTPSLNVIEVTVT